MFRVNATVLLVLVVTACALPVPEEVEPSITTTTTTEEPTDYSPPSLIVIGDDIDSEHGGDDVDTSEGNGVGDTKQKRHQATTISPEELEARRQAFIMSLGGGGGGDDAEGGGPGGGLASSLTGLGSLATDVVSLLTANSNETFGPLREAKERARQNFPALGSTINTFFASARQYVARAWRGLAKNVRIKLTNILRFTLQVVTRLATTVGGLYNVFVSLLDVATLGATNAAKLGSRLLSFSSGAGVRAIASGTGVVKGLVSNTAILKPFNQAVKVGQGFVNGVSEDLFDKVEWANEGINSKLELAQALAPNFLLRAHENVAGAASSDSSSSAAAPGGGSGSVAGGYSKLHDDDDDDPTLVALASGVEQMMREGRETDSAKATSSTTEGSSSSSSSTTTTDGTTSTSSSTSTPDSSSSTTESGSTTSITDVPPHPQGLLNDIFGLQEQINELKQAIIANGTEPIKKGGDNSS